MIKKIIKKIIYGNRVDSETYINYLRKIGCTIGENTTIYAPRNTIIDEQKPWLIEIGDNVKITDGVRILTHGYDWSVLKVKYGDVLGSAGKVKIGNNVFIGVNTTILKGVTISDNVIIGANSLVNKDCLNEGVYAGNPAKFIMNLDEYYEKRCNNQLKEATECGIEYYKKFKKWPDKRVFREFFWLFENQELNSTFQEAMTLEGNSKKSYETFNSKKRRFNGYDEFLDFIKGEYENDKKNSIKN